MNRQPELMELRGGSRLTALEQSIWPWLVAFGVKDGKDFIPYSGGVLVHPRWVLTARHNGILKHNELAVVGQFDLTGQAKNAVEVECECRHHKVDVSMVRLSKDYTSLPVPTLVDKLDSWEKSVASGFFIGWGSSSCATWCAERVEVPFVNQKLCKQAWFGIKTVRSHHVCAGDSGKGPCNGESGIPLVVEFKGNWLLIGIMNFSAICQTGPDSAVSSRVSHVLKFVSDAIGGQLDCDK